MQQIVSLGGEPAHFKGDDPDWNNVAQMLFDEAWREKEKHFKPVTIMITVY